MPYSKTNLIVATSTVMRSSCLTTETVQGAALSLQSVDDVERGNGLALSVLGVGNGIANDALEERLQDPTGLLVDDYVLISIGIPKCIDRTARLTYGQRYA
jgi:hypothetical protein